MRPDCNHIGLWYEEVGMEQKTGPSCNLVKAQLIRGAVGAALLVLAAFLSSSHFYVSLALVGLSIIPLRGCPFCWTVGMYEALNKSRSRRAETPKT
jgi:hypothetical protein